MIKLSVNLNKIALLRNSREGNNPDLLSYAKHCIACGAHGLTVHPRPDQRHIRADDIGPLQALAAQQQDLEFNIEGNPFAPPQNAQHGHYGDYPGLLSLLEQHPPTQATFVPDGDGQLTSDHGFDLSKDGARLKPIIESTQALGIRVSLFMDPDLEQISRSADLGVERIELYTGPYAWAQERGENAEAYYQQFVDAAQHASSLGLGVNAGHDLNLDNLARFKELPNLLEVSIGHAITVESLSLGVTETIRAYLNLLNNKQEQGVD